MQTTLTDAINGLQKVSFTYDGKNRFCEPHVLGVQEEDVVLLCFQTGFDSSQTLPDWRVFKVSGITDLKRLPGTFIVRSPDEGIVAKWKQIIASVS